MQSVRADALRRIHVMGNSSAGKSTLGERLASALEVPFVELDALNWLPGWVGLNATDPDELDRRMREATAGDGWVVAGSYTAFAQRAFWHRVQVVIWLDLPRRLLLWRMLSRSWRRWRSRELLWGTNYESFWGQFCVWRRSESLLWWIWTQHAHKRRELLRMMADQRWSHVRFVRLVSLPEIEAFAALLERGAAGHSAAGPGGQGLG